METQQEEFEKMIELLVKEFGDSMGESREAIANFAMQRTLALAEILGSGEPGYEEAFIAARDSVVLFAGLKIGEEAEAADQVMLGAFTGAIHFAAIALV